jgi:uncharacterized zinc-type alcohol dehydrogenase-like protein
MLQTPAYAAQDAKSKLAPFATQRREPGPHDVLIDIAYCGVCHSDIHQARGEWGNSIFPMVPGHEIVGKVAKVGNAVKKWKIGDTVGVGCFVDSCRECEACKAGEEQFCSNGMSVTYNGYERANGKLDKSKPTYGGYSTRVTVNEDYVLRIPEGIPLDRAAPLLCAGITTYSPLRHLPFRREERRQGRRRRPGRTRPYGREARARDGRARDGAEHFAEQARRRAQTRRRRFHRDQRS